MTVPNLDAMSQADLMDFWMKYSRSKRKDAKALVGERKKYISITQDLASYAVNKATAMQCRLRGTIDTADMYERICDKIYDRLPVDLRW